MRHDGRADGDLRPVQITPNYLRHSTGSALIECGETKVICAATIEERVPHFLVGKGTGWVTAEYAMLPASTNTRSQREVNKGRASGRTLEIQRMIGRVLRSVIDRVALGERTIWVDCDVIRADGGTRTASITGGFVALALALDKLRKSGQLKRPVLTDSLAAISVGIVEGSPRLDLDYIEDSAAEVDMNVARTGDGRYVELQGTAEGTPFHRDQLDALLDIAGLGIDRLNEIQREVLGDAFEALMAAKV